MPHNTAKEIGQDENCNRVALVFSIAAGAPGSGEKATSAATSERHIVASGREQTRGRFSSTLWQSARERSANRCNSGHRGVAAQLMGDLAQSPKAAEALKLLFEISIAA